MLEVKGRVSRKILNIIFFNNIAFLSIKSSYKFLQFFSASNNRVKRSSILSCSPAHMPSSEVAVECRCGSHVTSSKECIMQRTMVSDGFVIFYYGFELVSLVSK